MTPEGMVKPLDENLELYLKDPNTPPLRHFIHYHGPKKHLIKV